MLRTNPARLNKLATLAVIPVLAFGVSLAVQSRDSAAPATNGPVDFADEGILVVANLQSEDLTIHRLGNGLASQTLALPGPPHEIARLGDRLYITLGRAGQVVEVDPFVPAILRTVPLAGSPHGIAIDSRGIHVTLDDADEVVTLDWATLEVTARRSTGDTPHAIAAHSGTLFVTDSRDNTVRRLDEGQPARAATGALPESIAVTGGLVITGDADAGQLSVFDADSLDRMATIPVPGRPVRLLMAGSHLLVSRNHAATVAVLALPDFTEVASIPTGPFPDGLCLSPTGRFVAVPSNGDGQVTIVDTAGWKALGTLSAGDGSGACAWIERD